MAAKEKGEEEQVDVNAELIERLVFGTNSIWRAQNSISV